MFGRSSFGTPQASSFGFGSPAANQNPFGQQANPMFGAANTSTFGTPAPAFGTPGNSVFGAQQPNATPLFGSSQASTFGSSTSATNSFGNALFGSANQPSSSAMFGTPATNTFSQQAKPAGFGFSTQPTTSLFGSTGSAVTTQTQQHAQQQQQPGAVFNHPSGSAANTGIFSSGNSFGMGVTPTAGTVIKFAPITGTDSMQKGGTSTMINTKHHCITCMKEYETKSLEELRYEDYAVNRKGPQQNPNMFGAGVQPGQSFMTGGQTSQPSLFNTSAVDNKSAFGQAAGSFGQNTGFGMQPQQNVAGQSIFGKPTGFGGVATTTTNTFGFNSSPAGGNVLFGSAAANQTNKPFGTAQQQPNLFGGTQPAQAQPFGSNLFGQTNTQQPTSTGLFGKPATGATSAFNVGAQPTSGFTFSQQTGPGQPTAGSNLFQSTTSKPNTGFGLFGGATNTATVAPAFGQQQASNAFGFNTAAGTTGAFGAKQPMFGQTTQLPQQPAPTFCLPSQQPTTNLFAQPQQKPNTLFGNTGGSNLFSTPFGTNQLGNTSTLGGTTGIGIFSMSQPNNFTQMQQQQQQQITPFGMNTGLTGLGTGGNLLGGQSMTAGTNMNAYPHNYQTAAAAAGSGGIDAAAITDIFGMQPHLLNLQPSKRDDSSKYATTDAKEIVKMLQDGLKAPTSSPTMTKRLNVLPPKTRKDMMFTEKDRYTLETTLNRGLNSSPRRLVLRSKSTATMESGGLEIDAGQNEVKVIDISGNRGLGQTSDVSRGGDDEFFDTSQSLHDESVAAGRGGPTCDDRTTLIGGRFFTFTPSEENLLPADSYLRRRSLQMSRLPPIMRPVTPKSTQTPPNDPAPPASLIPEHIRTQPQTTVSTATTGTDPVPTSTTLTVSGGITATTCGIRMTRPEYYTVPDISNLVDYLDSSDGTCMVEGFTIGRVGYGNVCFPDLMDVANLDIDKNVHFRYRELIVYPDDKTKPALGQGLNRPAQVTLDHVYPRDEKGNPIRNVEYIIAENFGESLRVLDVKYGIKFVDYRPETGSWVFKTFHFSKYGFTDSDEEDVNAETTTENYSDFYLNPSDAKQKISNGKITKKSASELNEVEILSNRGLGGISSTLDNSQHLSPNTNLKKTRIAQLPLYTGDDEIELFIPENSILNPSMTINGLPSSLDLDHIEQRQSLYEQQLRNELTSTLFMHNSSSQSSTYETHSRALWFDRDMADTAIVDGGDGEMTIGRTGSTSSDMTSADLLEVSATGDLDLAVARADSKRKLFNGMITKPRKQEMMRGEEMMTNLQPRMYQLINTTKRISKSITSAKNSLDMIAFKGRSFKVGWSRGFRYTTVLTTADMNSGLCNLVTSDVYHPATVIIADANRACVNRNTKTINCSVDDPYGDRIEEFLTIILQECEAVNHIEQDRSMETSATETIVVDDETATDKRGKDLPHFKPAYGSQGLLRIAELSAKLCNSERRQYYSDIWSLLRCLWGPGNETPMSRWEHFSGWLERVTAPFVAKNLSTTTCTGSEMDKVFDTILVHLSGHQISEACDVAIRHGVSKLALFISQMNCKRSTKKAIREQMASWRNIRSDQFISPVAQKIYTLAAGLPIDGHVNVCEDFEWLRSLAIHFWYVCSGTTTHTDAIAQSINSYNNSFKPTNTQQPYSKSPKPRFHSPQQADYHLIDNQARQHFDIIYLILQLVLNNTLSLEEILTPGTHTTDTDGNPLNPNDHRLSWLLLQTFRSLKTGRIDAGAMQALNVSFAGQLENDGLYKWAVFVLLFIDDVQARRDLVAAVLYRNVTEEDSIVDEELVVDLKLPPSWLHEVKATRYHLLGRHWFEYKHLSYTDKLDAMHSLFLRELAPLCVLNHRYGELYSLLKEISLHNTSQMTQWTNGGGFLYNYLNIRARLLHEQRSVGCDQNVLRHDANAICRLVVRYPFTSSAELACISEVSQDLVQCVDILLEQESRSYDEYVLSITALEEMLIMPPDYAMDNFLRVFGKFSNYNSTVMSCD